MGNRSIMWLYFFFSSRRRHTRCLSDWSSDVCSSDLNKEAAKASEGLISLSQMKTPLTASSATDCKAQSLLFQGLGSRDVVADFSGGTLDRKSGACRQL